MVASTSRERNEYGLFLFFDNFTLLLSRIASCFNGVDRPARLPLCAHYVDKDPYSFALSDFRVLFYKRSREVPCISLLVAAGFVLNAICPLEYFSNMTVMVEIVSRRVEFSCALSVFA